MAITEKSDFTFKYSDLADEPVYASPTALKTDLDSRAVELRTYINSTLLPALAAITDGASGADNIGATAISGLTGTTVQTLLESLKTAIDGAVLGSIPDASLTSAKLDDETYFGGQNGWTTTNVSNAYSLTTGRSLSSIPNFYPFKFKCNADATGNTTLNIDGVGALDILKANGSNVTNLKNGGIYTVVKDTTAFMLQGEGGEGTAVIADVLAPKTFTNDTGDTLTGTMVDRIGDTAALSSSVSSTTLKLLASDGYRDGVNDNVTITDADFVATNIKSGVDLFGVTGTLGAVKSIQTGTISAPFNTGPGGNSTYNLTISSVDVNSSIVFIDYIPENQVLRDSQFTATITTSTNVELERNTGNNAYTGDINYTVVEFESVNSMQKGENSIAASGTANVTISAVDTAKCLIFKSSRTADSSTSIKYDFQVTPFAKLTTSTNLQLNNTSLLSHTTAWQVIEFN